MEMVNVHGGPCLESSKREFDNLADFLGMDDLLDFSNDDIAGPILGPSLISPADICIPPPCEEIAELEWLSNFVEDDESFYYSTNFSSNGESKLTAAEGYNTSGSISITTTNNTTPSPSPSPSSSTSTSSSAILGNMAMAMAMAMGGSNSSSKNTSSSTSSSSNSCDGSLQVQTGTPVPGRARSKRPRKEGAALGWVSSHSRLTLSHPEPSSLSPPEPSYYKGYYEDSSNITFLDCSSTSTMAAESTPFLIHFKPSPTNPSTISQQPSTYNTPTPPPLPKKVTVKQSSWHAKTVPPSTANSSSSTTTTTTTSSSTTTTGETGQEAGGQCRKCLHCGSQKTPQWRAGPLGPKTLCNACGVRHKSGRLFPEYRPVASPTFVASVHSNSHRKVMEIRGLKQRTYYHHQHHHQQQQHHHVAITTTTTTGTTTGTTSCSPPSYSFPSFS